MKRRTLLLGVGSTALLGFTGLARRRPAEQLEVKIWLSEGAISRPAAADRAEEYIRRALEATGLAVNLSFGDSPIAPLPDNDQRVRRVTWPRMVLEGVVGLRDLDPVRDVNLLLTDGDVNGQSAGYAMENVAAIAGASHLAEMPPAERTPSLVDYSVPAAVTQLLLHECGHALGLGHDHGVVTVAEDTATISPMISGYAWAPESVRNQQLNTEVSACNQPRSLPTDHRRRLSMTYSECAEAGIRSYRR